jgi:hypothetical protein
MMKRLRKRIRLVRSYISLPGRRQAAQAGGSMENVPNPPLFAPQPLDNIFLRRMGEGRDTLEIRRLSRFLASRRPPSAFGII